MHIFEMVTQCEDLGSILRSVIYTPFLDLESIHGSIVLLMILK
jgi:hypothetical protein